MDIREEFLFCEQLLTTTKAIDAFNKIGKKFSLYIYPNWHLQIKMYVQMEQKKCRDASRDLSQCS
jgi:hypothetical protein